MPAPHDVLIMIESCGRNLDATNYQVDQLVYMLHGLTDEGIALIEEA